MKTRAFAAALAASTMVMAPVAAQAGTKAASMTAPVSYGSRSTAEVPAKKKAGEVLWILAGLAGLTGVLVATDVIGGDDDDDDVVTPGA